VSVLLTEDRGAIRVLTLNRPEKRNAFDVALAGALTDALAAASADDAVRVVVVTGSGPYFTAGVDVNVFVGMAQGGDLSQLVRLHEPIRDCTKPVIAAVQGPSVGMGVTLLPHFDLVYAAEHATFMVPFMRLGLGVEFAGSFHLTRALGLSRTKELVLRGKPIDAATAERWNLVTRTFPAASLMADVLEIAGDIAAQPAGAVKDARSVLAKGLQTLEAEAAVAEENRILSSRYGSPENVEAVMAFLSRKK
jgi:enoyl-CoA hydratase/carnithine racemase